MSWDWITPVGSGLIALAGLLFGWATSARSQRQTAELAREGNRHAQALAELAGDQARRLEAARHERTAQDRRAQRVEQSYVEIATTVIRLSAGVSGSGGTEPDAGETGTYAGETVPDELVRARVLVGLFARPHVREAFDNWLDRFEKLRFALGRESASDAEPPESTRDLRSKRDMWRRQARDARLKEVDGRERLIAAMADDLDG